MVDSIHSWDSMTVNVLIGDIGGTKTILAVYSTEGAPARRWRARPIRAPQYETLEGMVGEFFEEVPSTSSRACFGVAGPVIGRRARITNLTWVVDACSRVVLRLVGSGPAQRHAGGRLRDPGSRAGGSAHAERRRLGSAGAHRVLAPGHRSGGGVPDVLTVALSRTRCEGSHAAFAPVGPLQIGLLAYMNAQGFDHVSFERVCSGGLGIPNLYAYLKTTV